MDKDLLIGIISLLVGLILLGININNLNHDTDTCQNLGYDKYDLMGKCYKEVYYDDGTTGLEWSEGSLKDSKSLGILILLNSVFLGIFFGFILNYMFFREVRE